jgi:hypothetical protein
LKIADKSSMMNRFTCPLPRSFTMDDHSQSHESPPLGEWEAIVRAGIESQRLVPGAIAVGDTAAALYANHRVSADTDHLVADLKARFDDVRAALESSPEWVTARVLPPKMILGSLRGVEVGFRQMIRSLPVETTKLETPAGPLLVPTLDELLGMKAYLAYSRRATRDFVDFAALASCLSDDEALQTLLRSDRRYGELQSDSVSLEIAKALAEPQPYDLDSIDLQTYKGVQTPWNDWRHAERVCKRLGVLLSERLLAGNDP